MDMTCLLLQGNTLYWFLDDQVAMNSVENIVVAVLITFDYNRQCTLFVTFALFEEGREARGHQGNV